MQSTLVEVFVRRLDFWSGVDSFRSVRKRDVPVSIKLPLYLEPQEGLQVVLWEKRKKESLSPGGHFLLMLIGSK